MNLEELIHNAQKEATHPVVLELIQEFKEFAQVLGRFKTTPQEADPAEHEEILKKMRESHDRLHSHFLKVAATFGMTFDQFAAFIGNQSHFEPKAWEEIEKGKQTITESLSIPSEENKTKQKKLNKNLRI